MLHEEKGHVRSIAKLGGVNFCTAYSSYGA
jgi:hypothetical protein